MKINKIYNTSIVCLIFDRTEMKQNIKIIIIVTVILIFLIDRSNAFGERNNMNNIKDVNNLHRISVILDNSQNDTGRPVVNITYPNYPPTVTTGKLVIQGTASDSENGIHNVSAVAHTFPFNGDFPVPLASQPMQISPNNWSHWSVPLIINNTGAYRVVITAIDNAGNANYAETTINAASLIGESSNTTDGYATPKIAFVRPTFTETAYQEHGFYRFYLKYGFPPFGKNITTDLDMLTVKTPKSVSEFPRNDPSHLSNITSLVPVNGTELHDISYNYFPNPQKFWLP